MAQNDSDLARAKEILQSHRFRGSMWRGKTMDELTDQECLDCLKYIQETTGTYYIRKYSNENY